MLKVTILQAIFRPKTDTDKNTRSYWNLRWRFGLDQDQPDFITTKEILAKVKRSMARHDCKTVLEVGCGATAPLRGLAGVTHLDFSMNALKHSKLDAFILADITKYIPAPDNTFDAAFSSACLMHLPDNSIGKACDEIKRVTKRLIILNEGGQRDLSSYFEGRICEQPFR